ncbi:MAG: hypothetical protein HZA68_12980 [Rhodovulum sp.]|nr:hypothetical protein [Rhodovulum sp.]
MSLDLLRRFGAPRATWNTAESGGGGAASTGAAAGGGSAAAGASGAGADPAPAASGGDAPAPWHASLGLDKDTADWIAGHKFGDLKSALASARHFEKVARDRNVMAKPDPLKPGEWDGWSELGWKPDRKDYVVEPIKPKRGGEADAGLHAAIVDAAHAAKLPLDQTKAVYGAVVGHIDTMLEQVQTSGAKARQDLERDLRTEWGTSYDQNVELARRGAKTLGLGALETAELERITSSPVLLKAFYRLGVMVGEDRLAGLDGGGSAAPQSAKAELDRLQADEAFMKVLDDPRHPLQAEYKARRNRLIERIASGGSK